MPRYYYQNSRDTVESKREISIFELNDEGLLPQDGGVRKGSIQWSINGKPNGNIKFVVNSYTTPTGDYSQEHSSIRFVYKVKDTHEPESAYESMDYTYDLTRTECNFGGYRWWFRCGGKDGTHCQNRVGKLYLVGRKFVCRDCANLTYESCNESKLVRRYPFSVLKYEKKARESYEKINIPYYNGKPTKQLKRFLKYKRKMIEEAAKAPEESVTDLLEDSNSA